MTTKQEIPLYRYLSTNSLLYLLVNKKIRLGPVSSWIDRYEGTKYLIINKAKTAGKDLPQLDKVFGSSWTHQKEERCLFDTEKAYKKASEELQKDGSAAMWEAYCGNGGVRIKTTTEKIMSLIKPPDGYELIHKDVHYEAFSDWSYYNKNKNISDLLFVKKTPYRYESEYRFILIPNKDPGKQDILEFGIPDIYDFLDEVLVFPPKSKGEIWIAEALYKLGWQIILQPPRHVNINTKNGVTFSRISQLYEQVSHRIR